MGTLSPARCTPGRAFKIAILYAPPPLYVAPYGRAGGAKYIHDVVASFFLVNIQLLLLTTTYYYLLLLITTYYYLLLLTATY